MTKRLFSLRAKKISFKRYPVTFLLLSIIFFLLALYFLDQFLMAPKLLLICCIILAAGSLGKLDIFIKDWFVFLSFLYLFDSLRGTIYILTCKFSLPVYTIYVIKLEKLLFGNIPSVTLQNILLKGTNYNDFTWIEKFCTLLHGTHFVAFLLIALAIWIHKPHDFSKYKTSFYSLTSVGIAGYFIIPTVPPWMASLILNIIPATVNFPVMIYNTIIPDISGGFDTNPIAAMPSLHAAFPFLCSLILFRFYRWKASPFFLYTFLIFFTIVYSANHYVVDIIAGAILAYFCYLLTFNVKWGFLKSRTKRNLPSKQSQSNIFKKHKHLIIGISMLIIGISIGSGNKRQFRNNAQSYDFTAIPRYVDFFNSKEDYTQNYYVQIYLGKYYLARGKIEKALLHFKNALSVSKTDAEKTEAQNRLEQCYSLKGKKNME